MSLSTFNNKEKIPLLEPNVYVGPPSFPVMSLFKEEGFYEQNLFKQPKSFSPSTPESPTELEDFKKDTKDKEEKDQDYKINVGHWTREEHGKFFKFLLTFRTFFRRV